MAPPRDPRVERTREAVLEAACTLLRCEGPQACTHVRVAEAAGVGRATVYRHWPEQSELLRDAVERKVGALSAPDPSLPVSTRVSIILELLCIGLNDDDRAKSFAMLIGRAEWDPNLRQALLQLAAHPRGILSGILGDGVARHELALDTDVDVLCDQLIGALVARRFLSDAPLDSAYVARVVQSAVPAQAEETV